MMERAYLMNNQNRKYRAALAWICLAGLGLMLGGSLNAQSGYSTPQGYITWVAGAGTGSVKKVTPLSMPFLHPAEATGSMTGEISAVTDSSITDSLAGWTAGQLSNPAKPCLIRITSGAAAGRTLLISTSMANTATAVTIDAKDVAQSGLLSLGIAPGDHYEIFECGTLASVFGTPATTGVQGGTGAANADSLMISVNGTLETYYYSTTLNRWTKSILGNPDASNTPLRPDSGIFFSRLAATDWRLVLPGQVSTTSRSAAVKNSGTTILAQNWPLDTTLGQMRIQLISGWTAGPAASADKVKIVANGVTDIYWFDGSNWRKQASGSPLADNQLIPAGSAVILEQLGTQQGYGTLTQPMPYTVE